jgi:hypothetical protein
MSHSEIESYFSLMKRNNQEVLMHATLEYYKMNNNQDFIICFTPKVAIFQFNKIVTM